MRRRRFLKRFSQSDFVWKRRRCFRFLATYLIYRALRESLNNRPSNTKPMLPRAQRLKTRQFSVAFAQGRMVRHPLLVLRIYQRSQQAKCRAAFVVAKKLAPAAKRNRARRRIREIYRLNPLRCAAHLQSCDLIFAATPASLEASHEALQKAMESVLRRVGRNVPPAKAAFEN